MRSARFEVTESVAREVVAARWISIVAHPFAMSVVMVLGVALQRGDAGEAFWTVALVALVALLPVAALMARQVRRGSWANVDASDRAERPLLFVVGMAALAMLLVVVLVFRSQSFLVRGGIGVLIMLAVCAVATKWVKVSLHMAFGALATSTLLLLGSRLGWVVFAVLPALAWSRLALDRHSAAEVAVGTLIGFAAGYAITSL
jgi:hypothetical protein